MTEPLPSPSRFEQRARRTISCAAALLCSLLATGCPEPGDLDRASTYCKPGQSIVGGNNQVIGCSDIPSGGTNSPATCESDCITAMFSGPCRTCHNKGAPLGQLDLETPGVTARLKDQPAKHAEISNPQGCPSGDKLVDSADPQASWLLKKIMKQQGTCGTPMPPEGASPADVTCVTAYVTCLGASP